MCQLAGVVLQQRLLALHANSFVADENALRVIIVKLKVGDTDKGVM